MLGAVDFELVRPRESGVTAQGRHTVAGELVLHALRSSICEASFMAHQRGPIDRHPVVGDALAPHQASSVNHFRASAENLFRITAAQCASARVGKRVDDAHAHPWMSHLLAVVVPAIPAPMTNSSYSSFTFRSHLPKPRPDHIQVLLGVVLFSLRLSSPAVAQA